VHAHREGCQFQRGFQPIAGVVALGVVVVEGPVEHGPVQVFEERPIQEGIIHALE